jgi:hypothetical protein
MKHQEYDLQKAVCNYLNAQYPDILYISTGTSLKLTMMQAVRNKAIQKNDFKCPDLLILEPKYPWLGLFIELKIEPYLKQNGNFKSEHIKAQNDTLFKLNNKMYYATFSVGFEQTKRIIDEYLKG